MQKLAALIESKFVGKNIDFTDSKWLPEIPVCPGWYFLETNTPTDVLARLPHPASNYINANGDEKKCGNYDISSRAEKLTGVCDFVINNGPVRAVYSGMANDIRGRARDHIFAHPGTAALALSNYIEIQNYDWVFYYLINNIKSESQAHEKVILKLGEEIWRSHNGWPILCAG